MELNDINTLAEAAEYLRLSERTLRARAREGKIGYLPAGRSLTFTREHLRAYIAAESREVITTPDNPWGLTDASLRRARRGR